MDMQADVNHTPKKKERVQLDFSQESLQRLDTLKMLIGAGTRAETIRQALRLFDWFINETDPDSVIEVTNKQGEVTSKFKASLLHGSVTLS
jgi:metal-responsive CopG/Arc/MetJ family transcriptional regulator